MSETLEIVTFRLADHVSRDAFVTASREIEDWTAQQAGFMSRTLSVSDDGTWSDIALWSSHETAEAAHANFMPANGNSEFLKMIDLSSLKMSYSRVASLRTM